VVQESVIHFSLQEAITASVSSNDAIKLAVLDVQVAETKFRQANTVYLPQANFSYTASATNNPLNAFGSKLQQRPVTETAFNPHMLNNPLTITDFSAMFELQQPLLNIDMFYQRFPFCLNRISLVHGN
jgi:outer membrane protein TolC